MLSAEWPEIATKSQAWELESGTGGLTRHAWSQGLETRVVGRDGSGLPPARMAVERTFRSGGQANLLVADNRTREWDDGQARASAPGSRASPGARMRHPRR